MLSVAEWYDSEHIYLESANTPQVGLAQEDMAGVNEAHEVIDG